jgi:integrase
MSIFKRGNVYWYHFMFNGEHVQKSTKQGNPRVARNMESAYRTALAKGEVGIIDRKPVPTLADFLDNRFEPWARATFEKASPKTWAGWYRTQIANIRAYAPLVSLKLDAITSERAADYAAHLQTKGWLPSSVNSSLRVLRRALRLAVEWGIVQSSPKIKLLRGEHHRDRVVTPDEERRYLGAAGELMADLAAVLLDTGMRPEENARLLWESILWGAGTYGTLQVTHGKTAAARRMLPLSPRVRSILERRWEAADKPVEGWVWATGTASGHIEPSTVKKQHKRALRLSGVRPFVLYSLRHTFLTRLGGAGCDAWTLARIAGHSSIAMSARYVHPNADAVMNVFARMEAKKALSATVESVN